MKDVVVGYLSKNRLKVKMTNYIAVGSAYDVGRGKSVDAACKDFYTKNNKYPYMVLTKDEYSKALDRFLSWGVGGVKK
jgi:hypothetical protein